MFPYGPGLFDVVFDLFVSPGKTAAVDAFRVIYLETVFVVTVDYDEVSGGGEVAGADRTDKDVSFVQFGFKLGLGLSDAG